MHKDWCYRNYSAAITKASSIVTTLFVLRRINMVCTMQVIYDIDILFILSKYNFLLITFEFQI